MFSVVTAAFTVVSMVIRTTVFLVSVIGHTADPLPPDQGPQIGNANYTTLQVRPFQRTRQGAGKWQTANFVVHAPTQAFAQQVGAAAEQYRHDLAVAWLGKPLPGNWSQPCPITCNVGTTGTGGVTSFRFENGEVVGWRMNIQGSRERILDSVLPHEVSHTIFASHFRRPLPRWADEGAATLVEHEAELQHQRTHLAKVRRSRGWIPLNRLLTLTQYPQDMRDVLTLYAEGWSLTDFLVQQRDRQTFVAFIGAAHQQGWNGAVTAYYGMQGVEDLETQWTAWMDAGSGTRAPQVQVAVNVGMPVLDVWTTDNCVYCDRFKADYYRDKAFRARLDAAYTVRIRDATKEPGAVRQAGVTAFPTFLVPARGKRVEGYGGKAQLLRQLRTPASSQQYAEPIPAAQPQSPPAAPLAETEEPPPVAPTAPLSLQNTTTAGPDTSEPPAHTTAAEQPPPVSEAAKTVAETEADTEEPKGLFGKFHQAILETIRMLLAAAVGWFVSWRASQGFIKRRIIDRIVSKAVRQADDTAHRSALAGRLWDDIIDDDSDVGPQPATTQQPPYQPQRPPIRRRRRYR